MCDHCLAHQEFREALDSLLNHLPPEEKNDTTKFDHPYLDLVEEIPGGRPDGTGIFTPLGWVRWAKKKLNYPVGGSKTSQGKP